MRLTGFAEINENHSEKFLRNAKNKNLLKIKRILITEIQANRGAHFLHLACQGGRRAPLPPVSYAPAASPSSYLALMGRWARKWFTRDTCCHWFAVYATFACKIVAWPQGRL